jgi:hypothetical protein
MPNWKKVITSGSDASLNTLTVVNGITGSLLGTASYASQALSASYALTSSYSTYALTSSYSLNPTVSGSINNVDYIDFNTGSAVPAWKSGRIFWDNTEGCLSVYNAEADITLQVGQENWTRVFNGTGVTIANGAAVRIVGTHGDHPEVVLAQSVQISGSSNITNQILGIATHAIEASTFGYITTQGLVRGLNTNAFTDGDTLYVSSSAGQLTNTPPLAPYEIIPVGQVVKASPGGSGILYIAVQQPLDFGDLSSVYVTGSYSDGDLWSYNGPTKTWRHTNQLSGSYAVTGSWSATSFTGSLLGTASYATQALSSSFATTASYVLNAVSASFAATSSTTAAVNGTINYIPRFVSSSILGNSNILQSGSNIGIGISPQLGFILDINGQSVTRGSVYISGPIIEFGSTAYKLNTGTGFSWVSSGSGNFGVGTTVDSGYKFDVSGSTRLNGNTLITGSLTLTGAISTGGQGYFAQGVWANIYRNLFGVEVYRITQTTNNLLLGTTTDSAYRLDVSGSGRFTSNLEVSGSARIKGYANTSISSSLVVLGSGSSQPIFTVQGSQGELFSVTDSLSGSLFSVNDISGLPVLEAFSDNTVLLGSYQAPALLTTNKIILTASGNFTLSSLPTASYDGAFYDYTARSGSNARAGSMMAIWGNGGTVNFTETTTTDFGNTTGLNLGVFVIGGNMVLTGSASTTAWTIKTIIRSI